MSIKPIALALLAALALPATVRAQQTETFYRLELGGGLGMNLGVNDLKRQVGLSASGIARFPLNHRMAVKTLVGYGTVKGSTTGLKAFLPADPNATGDERLQYSVSAGVVDVNALYELHFLPYGYERGYQGYKRLVPYLQLGLGVVYATESKAVTAAVPLGVGLKYKAAPRLNLGLDFLMHFTMSDKIDGLDAPLGISSSMFRNKDHYATLQFTLTYDLRPKCPTCNRDLR